jgi:hypothetical protein
LRGNRFTLGGAMKHWSKCLLLTLWAIGMPASTPLAISAAATPAQMHVTARIRAELVANAATQKLARIVTRPQSLSRLEQVLLFGLGLGLVALQVRRRHEILSTPRLLT